jgi:vesicle-fusing ATPase
MATIASSAKMSIFHIYIFTQCLALLRSPNGFTLTRRRCQNSIFHGADRTTTSSLRLQAEVIIDSVLQAVNVTSRMTLSENSIFDAVASRASVCLLESDIRRDAIGKGTGAQASSATNWIHDAGAFALKKTMDRVKIKLADERVGIDRDEASSWLRWMKAIPSPAIVDLSMDFRATMNLTISDYALQLIDQSRAEFLSRVACRLVLLPSGASLSSSLTEPPASIIYGKLLYGGVTRFRLLTSSNSQAKTSSRKTGLRTEVKPKATDIVPAWMMYGGPSRLYEAIDMGPAAILEVALLPRGKTLTELLGENMQVAGMLWKPQNMFAFVQDESKDTRGMAVNNAARSTGYSPASLSGGDRNDAFRSDFQSAVGGLQKQIDAIVRRVLDGRVIRPAEADSQRDDETAQGLSTVSLEAQELALLGLSPVRGLLLYGPPGCGKTVLAREISRALRARSPKIVSAPELLDRWVGGSEKLVRALFAEAEAELAVCNGDATKSALHVVVIDEIDAVFRKRSSSEESGEATRSSVVNQILAKLDGVHAISNVLLIGMTNRRELLDDALLRPGRLEVQIEVPLPDRDGRREILQIHFDALRKRGRLSRPLCCAIDGVPPNYDSEKGIDPGADLFQSQNGRVRKRDTIKRAVGRATGRFSSALRPAYDLAADYVTNGFSGADIAGLVRCAGSIALSRSRKEGSGVNGLLITLDDVKQALTEVTR